MNNKQNADLKVMALDGFSNAQIAAALNVGLEVVHAVRSQMGYTIPTVAEIKTTPCDCCGSPTPLDADYEYTMPDGVTLSHLCERCRMTVDYVNSFCDADEDENEDECEDDDDVQGD